MLQICPWMCELHTTQSRLADLPGSEWEESPEKMDLTSGYKIGLASFHSRKSPNDSGFNKTFFFLCHMKSRGRPWKSDSANVSAYFCSVTGSVFC